MDLRERRRLKEAFRELTAEHILLYTYLEKYPGDSKKQKRLNDIRQRMSGIKAYLG